MITPRKFLSLPPKTRLRKLVNLLQKAEMDFHHQKNIDFQNLDALIALAAELLQERKLADLPKTESSSDPAEKLRILNNWRHFLMQYLEIQTAEWDLILPETGELDQAQARQLPLSLYLEDIRSPFNVGSIFRTAYCFGVENIFISPMTPRPDHPRARRTARGCESQIKWQQLGLDKINGDAGIFALETGGQSLGDFKFPQRGLVLIGSEELGLSPEALALADHNLGRVSIPMLGAKRSLNVSVAFGILMNAWVSYLEKHK